MHTRPENARIFFTWEKTETSEIERNWRLGARLPKRLANGFELCVSHFADEFERDVKILCAYPLGLRRDGAKIADQRREIFSYRRGNLQRDEEAPASGPFRAARRGFPAVVQEMDAHHIARELRAVPADRFAVAGEPHTAFFDASGVRHPAVPGSRRPCITGSVPHVATP